MGAWVTYSSSYANIGVKVASYPDHGGRVKEGRIADRYELYSDEYIEVVYDNGEECHLCAGTGRYSKRMDTSLDVGMIWVE